VVVVALDRLDRSLSDVIRTVETLTAAWCYVRLDSSRDNHTAMSWGWSMYLDHQQLLPEMRLG
jgi:hypothetical protein